MTRVGGAPAEADLERRFGGLRRLYGDAGYARLRGLVLDESDGSARRSLPGWVLDKAVRKLRRLARWRLRPRSAGRVLRGRPRRVAPAGSVRPPISRQTPSSAAAMAARVIAVMVSLPRTRRRVRRD